MPATWSASNSSTWNGLVGLARRGNPGENTGRFGVDTAIAPPGTVTRRHSARKPARSHRCSITCSDTTADTDASASGKAARLPRTARTRGYDAATWPMVTAS